MKFQVFWSKNFWKRRFSSSWSNHCIIETDASVGATPTPVAQPVQEAVPAVQEVIKTVEAAKEFVAAPVSTKFF